jgi:hypothetical protein
VINPPIPTTPGFFLQLLALYAYLLPILLYVLWSALALADMGRRTPWPIVQRVLWAAAVFFVPYLGAAAYLLLGGAQMARSVKLTVLGGGLAAYAFVLLIGVGVGGLA